MTTNILGTPLQPCCFDPKTGFTRDGYCQSHPLDSGSHTVCAVMTEAFLAYTKTQGNDLSTPQPHFPGLQPGDYWCVCAARWLQAHHAGVAPPIKPASTHADAVAIIEYSILQRYFLQ